MKKTHVHSGDTARIIGEVRGEQLEQMKLVERVVRPVRASRFRKRKMREELLSHVSSLYEEEHSLLGDPKAAIEAAARRFGEPGELTSELQHAVPFGERWLHLVRRFLGGRPQGPHETEVRFTARVCGYLLVEILIAVAAFPCLLGWPFSPGNYEFLWMVVLPVIVALAMLFWLYTFLTGLLYIKMRDSLWGAFGTRRSMPAVLKYAMGIALAAFVGTAFTVFALGIVLEWKHPGGAISRLLGWSLVGIFAAWLHYDMARKLGPEDITDRIWASLVIQTD